MDLSGTVLATIDESGKIEVVRHFFFECICCTDCCSLNNVPLTERDIDRLMDNGIELDQAFEEMSPVLIASKDLEKGFIKAYIMRKKPFVNECVFLEEKGLCRIHQFKPIACRLYPFSIRKTDEGYEAIVHPKNVCNFIELDVKEERSNTIEIVEKLMNTLFE